MSNSINGISSIELIPTISDRQVVRKLEDSLKRSASLRAAVAYWRFGVKQLGQNLISRLSGKGYLCVDIHLPTDIDLLADMVKGGANVYLYLLNPNPQHDDLRMKIPPHLLHPKMLLFEFDSPPSELWVGSHNWTNRALTGVNIEASLRVTLETRSELYISAAKFLDDIKHECVRFDLSATRHYKWLQEIADDKPIWVLRLEGSKSDLTSHRKLTIFGTSDEDYKNLKRVDEHIVLALDDNQRRYLFEATISDTGRVGGSGISFGRRLYATNFGQASFQLVGPSSPPASVITTSNSWATIEILEELHGEISALPSKNRWENLSNDEARLNLPQDLLKWFAEPKKPLVQRPVSREIFEGGIHEDSNPPNAALLMKMIVKAKRLNGEIFAVGRKK